MQNQKQQENEIRKLQGAVTFLRDSRTRLLKEFGEINRKFDDCMISIDEYDALVNVLFKEKDPDLVMRHYDTQISKYSQKIIQIQNEIEQEEIFESVEEPREIFLNSSHFFLLVSFMALLIIFFSFASNPTAFAVFLDDPEQDQQKNIPEETESSPHLDSTAETKPDSTNQEIEYLGDRILTLAKNTDLTLKKDELIKVIDKIGDVIE
jgi:hypothetical protein